MRIGVDLMGSDTAPHILFEAVLQAIPLLDPTDTLVVFANLDVVNLLKKDVTSSSPKIEWKIAHDLISMSDDPLTAVRYKKKSSIILGIKSLKKRSIDAFISAGNTGALVTSATLYLPKFLKASRPALLALLPTKKGSVAVIDVGGNVSCKKEHLVQFAKMGAAYQSCHLDIEMPRVGLLNIGAESKKGSLEVRQAYEMLEQEQSSTMQFVGNVEGFEVFQGKVDVLVTNGTAGNILLKTAEGIASFIFESLKQNHQGQESSFQALQKQFDYAEYPGAIVAGVDGIVIKCHGHSSARAMYTSIKSAISLHRKDFLTKLKERLHLA